MSACTPAQIRVAVRVRPLLAHESGHSADSLSSGTDECVPAGESVPRRTFAVGRRAGVDPRSRAAGRWCA